MKKTILSITLSTALLTPLSLQGTAAYFPAAQMTVCAAETEEPKYEMMTYKNMGDHIEITGSDSGIKEARIPETIDGLPVTVIGDTAFQSRRGRAAVTIPASVTRIGAFAFCNCPLLTSLTIPDSVSEIGQEAFRSCTGLTEIYCSISAHKNQCTNCVFFCGSKPVHTEQSRTPRGVPGSCCRSGDAWGLA